jgi:hypothetical protein
MGQSAGVVRALLREPSGPRGCVLVVGYEGSVGHALLRVLADSEVGRDLVGGIDRLVLLDERPSEEPSVSTQVQVLAPRRVDTREELSALLGEYAIDQLIDLSDLAVLDCIEACASAGVSCVAMRRPGDPRTVASTWLARSGAVKQARSHLLVPAGATAFATAAALAAGWMQLGAVAGVHTIEQLDARAYRDCVDSLLNPVTLRVPPAFARAGADLPRPMP